MPVAKAVNPTVTPYNDYTRRGFLQELGKVVLAAGSMSALPFMLPGKVSAAPLQALTNFSNNRNGDPWVLVRKPGTEVRPLVIIFMGGGPNQKIFDPKPDAPENLRGLFETINTKEAGLQLSELLPKTARNIDDFRLIRCMQARNLDHAQGAALTTTGNSRVVGSEQTNQRADPRHDAGHIKLAEFNSRRTLGCVMLSTGSYNTFGALQPRHRYVTSYVECDLNNNYTFTPQLRSEGNPERAMTVLDLRNAFERGTNSEIYGAQGRNIDEIYENVRTVLGRNFSRAFDPNVPDKVRAQVGYGPFANAAIVASNLIQERAPLVFLNLDGWDTHDNEVAQLKNDITYRINGKEVQGPGLGFAFDNVINYLRETVGDTAVIAAFGEFGRTPTVNNRLGTDHGTFYSMLFTGAGVTPGVTGQTDSRGENIISRERYNEETALEAALNLAGYMRVKVIGNSVIPPNPERFPTQSWINN